LNELIVPSVVRRVVLGGASMKRATRLLVTFGLLGMAPFLLGQASQPTLPSDILGPQLIAWSQQHKPQPVPQPLPDPPDQQQAKQSSDPVNPQAQQQPEVQTFTGKIVKDRAKYVLKVSNDDVYQLDDQEKVQTYEGKDVKLVGTLDEGGRSIRVTSIQVIS
jgi:hypothetical protein